MLPTRDSHWPKTHRLRVNGRKKTFQAKGNPNKTGIAILTAHNTDFKLKMVGRDKDSHQIMIMGKYIKKIQKL